MIILIAYNGQSIVLDYNPWQNACTGNANGSLHSSGGSGRYNNIALDVTCGDIAKMAMRQYMKIEIDKFYKKIEQDNCEYQHNQQDRQSIHRGVQLRLIQRQFQGCRIIGLYSNQTKTIHYHDELFPFQPDYMISPTASYKKFSLLLSGPINEAISEDMLKKIICTYLLDPNTSKVTLPTLNSLLRVSKRFRRICSSNDVWMHVNYPSSLWNLGIGSEGSEETIWGELQFEHGLSRKEIFKLRRLSYFISRLKLFYGTLHELNDQKDDEETIEETPNANTTIMNEVNWNGMKQEAGMHQMHVGYNRNQSNPISKLLNYATKHVVPRLLKTILPHDNSTFQTQRHSQTFSHQQLQLNGSMMPQHTILIVGIDSQNLSQRLLQQLHFIIPSSATNFHFHPCCQPLLPNGKLLDIESSPAGSRSRSSGRDAGTRIECSSDYKFQYRRLGDLRLTFLQLNSIPKLLIKHETNGKSNTIEGFIDVTLSPQKEREIQFRKFWNIFKCQTIGYMLVLEYQSGYVEKILREVEDFLKVTFLSTPTNQRTQHDYDGIDQDGNSTNQKGIAAIMLPPLLVMVGYGDPSDSRAFLILSQFISQVYQIIERFFKHHQDHRMWFIQPFYSFSEEGNLKQGIFAGMNWLIRKLMKQNECRMHN